MAEPGAIGSGKYMPDSDTDNKYSDNDALAVYLKNHNLYDDLYYQLVNVDGMDLDMLQNDLRLDEVDECAKRWKLQFTAKLKFRKLMRIIANEKKVNAGSSAMDEYRAKMRKTEFLMQQKLKPDIEMNVFLVGDSAAGKTALMRSYCGQEFDSTFSSTVGVGDKMKNIQPLADDTNMGITVWDTAGQERYQSECVTWYKRADCMIICYDISEAKNDPFEKLAKWRKQIEENARDDVVVVIAGCKTDKADKKLIQKHQKTVKAKTNKKGWEKIEPIVCECSAKTGHNVEGVFNTCAQLVLKAKLKHVDRLKMEKARVNLENKDLRAQLQAAEQSRCGC